MTDMPSDWFEIFMSFLGTLGVPWAIWLTTQVHKVKLDTATISVRLEAYKTLGDSIGEVQKQQSQYIIRLTELISEVRHHGHRISVLESAASQELSQPSRGGE